VVVNEGSSWRCVCVQSATCYYDTSQAAASSALGSKKVAATAASPISSIYKFTRHTTHDDILCIYTSSKQQLKLMLFPYVFKMYIIYMYK
jgi:hypothetical protein